MPRVDIWIRKEDFDKWNAIEKKSEFIHNALNTTHISTTTLSDLGKSLDIARPLIGILKQGKGGLKLCKHGNVKGSCFEKTALRLKCNF